MSFVELLAAAFGLRSRRSPERNLYHDQDQYQYHYQVSGNKAEGVHTLSFLWAHITSELGGGRFCRLFKPGRGACRPRLRSCKHGNDAGGRGIGGSTSRCPLPALGRRSPPATGRDTAPVIREPGQPSGALSTPRLNRGHRERGRDPRPVAPRAESSAAIPRMPATLLAQRG